MAHHELGHLFLLALVVRLLFLEGLRRDLNLALIVKIAQELLAIPESHYRSQFLVQQMETAQEASVQTLLSNSQTLEQS